MTTELTPSYMDLDFDSIKQDIIDKMKQSPVFQDYKYDASNITILIELMAYIGSLNSYYLNKIAKNIYLDTADLRENVIRMGYLVGYYPRGGRSATSVPLAYDERQSYTIYTIGDKIVWTPGPSTWECKNIELTGTTGLVAPSITSKIVGDTVVDGNVTWECLSLGSGLTITISPSANGQAEGCQIGDTIMVNAWKEVYTDAEKASYESEPIYFTTTADIQYTITSFPAIISVPIAQGRLQEYEYTGSDLIDETIYLPSKAFGYDDNLTDDYPSVEVRVGTDPNNAELWYRVVTFYDETSGLNNEDNVYVLRLNKYDQYIIRFSNAKNVPGSNDTIYVKLIETLGSKGNVSSSTITFVDDTDLITVTTPLGDYHTLSWEKDYYTVTNYDAVYGGADAETTESMKTNIEGAANSQYRCVTRSDYVFFLESHNDVKKAIAWGEQDSTRGGNILEYNKVYIAIYPVNWSDMVYVTYTTDNGGEVRRATSYTEAYLNKITAYLEPYKMLCAYEDFSTMPDFTYFRFHIGIKIKRNYRFDLVKNDVKNKLAYYFNSGERVFGQTISYMEIINYILDPTKTSSIDNFNNVKGIYHLNIRNIDFFNSSDVVYAGDIGWRNPYEYDNVNAAYPQWSRDEDLVNWQENTLREVLLYFNQYPMLSSTDCRFDDES